MEFSTSQNIETIKLYYKYRVVTESVALVFAHGRIDNQQVDCSQMLKQGLKVDRVHTHVEFSLSQIEEKITWVIEKT